MIYLHRAISRRNKRLQKSGFERTRFPDASPIRAIQYQVATSRAELEAAFRLVYRSYVEVGLQAENELGLRFSKYHLLPKTKVLIAIAQGKADPNDAGYLSPTAAVVGTMTLVLDSPLGLPMEEVSGHRVRQFLQAGRRLAEVIGLAIHPQYRGINNTLRLFRLMTHYARYYKITDLGASVTPRHVEFYRSILRFLPMGERQRYSSANGLEVQPHFLDVMDFPNNYRDESVPELFDCNLADFFNGARPDLSFVPGAWSASRVRYFCELNPEFRASLTDADLRVLRAEFAAQGRQFPFRPRQPRLDLARWLPSAGPSPWHRPASC